MVINGLKEAPEALELPAPVKEKIGEVVKNHIFTNSDFDEKRKVYFMREEDITNLIEELNEKFGENSIVVTTSNN